MKKVLLILFILVLLAVGAIALFIATFDANQFKSTAEEKLTESVGNPVRIGKIDLTWQAGLSLAVQDLAIYKGAATTPSFEIQEANASLKLLPLLNRNIELGTVTLIRPDLSLRRNRQGKILVEGINLDKFTEENESQKKAIALPFLIKTIRLEGGNIRFRDQMTEPESRLSISHLSIELENVSLIRPTNIKAEAAFFANEPNIKIEGRFYPPRPGFGGALKKTQLEIDLNRVQLGDMIRDFPPSRAWGIRNRLGGLLRIDAEEIPLDPKKLEQAEGSLKMQGGYIEHDQVKDPIEDITIDANLRKNELELQTARASWAGSKIAFSGNSSGVFTYPKSRIKGRIENFDLTKLATKFAPGEPHLMGILNASFDGSVDGADWITISTSMTGAAEIRVEDPVLVNVNILREVFSKLSMIPGLEARLRERLRPEYLQKLDEKNTKFENIHIKGDAERGVIHVDNARLASETFELTGSATSTLNGMVDTQFMLTLDADLSGAFIRSVEELSFLSDNKGRLQIPLSYRGHVQHFRPLPNLQYVASKLTVDRAQELIGNLLNKHLGKRSPEKVSETAAEAGTKTSEVAPNTTTPPTPKDPLQDLLGGLLQKALES